VSNNVVQHPALELYDAGYHDVISIAPPNADIAPSSKLPLTSRGKAPARRGLDGYWRGFAGWQDATIDESDVQQWVQDGANIGLRTRHYPAIDVDVLDPETAGVIESTLVELFPGVPRRFGRAPKFAMPFRTNDPFGKIRFRVSKNDGTEQGVVEILGDGQQFVVHGVHPGTGRQFVWQDDTTSGGVEVLAKHPPTSLPLLTPEIIEQRVLPLLEERLAPLGIRVERDGGGRKRDDFVVDQHSLRAPSVEALREAVERIPNDERWADRHDWITMGFAIKAAAGPEHDADGWEIFSDWSGRFTVGSNAPENVRTAWVGLSPPFEIGWSFIENRAREFGYGVGDEFTYDDAVPAGTEAERIAALLGDAERAYFFAGFSLQDESPLARWDKLLKATATADPLKRLFDTVVLEEAISLRAFANDDGQFATVMRARLHGKPAWNISEEDRRLLLNAAYAFIANKDVLVRRVRSTGVHALPRTATDREYLVAGWIPHRGLAAFIGDPANGKTFSAIELAARVAKIPVFDGIADTPETFAGRDVGHGAVLYFPTEDADGVVSRRSAWEREYGPAERFHLFSGFPPLSRPAEAITVVRQAIANAMAGDPAPVRLVVIDPFRTAFEGNENDSETMSTALGTAALIAELFDTAVLLVHHTGKNDKSQGRGSSVFTAQNDFIATVEKRDANVTLMVTKNKHAPGGDRFTWNLENEVLRSGLATTDSAGLGNRRDEYARIVAEVVNEIATPTMGVSRRDIRQAAISRRPDLFGEKPSRRPGEMNRTTGETHLSEGIKAALENKLIELRGRSRRDREFFPGPAFSPSPLDPGSLEDLI
jgi:hypothetical protein